MGKKTPFYDIHVAAGAKIIDFGGYDMPVYYSTLLDEHHATRNAATVFDVSHMGEIRVTGKQALELLQYLTPRDISKSAEGRVALCVYCNEGGGIIDDLTIYTVKENEEFYVVVNAGPLERDFTHMVNVRDEKGFDAEVINESDETAKLDVQGPKAEEIVQQLVDVSLNEIKFYRFALGNIEGVPATVSRSGYTGEDGFELYFPARTAKRVWEALFAAGEKHGLKPAGLGARDTLRLESGFMLSGQDFNEDITPFECVYGWTVHLDKGDFVGRESLVRQQAAGVEKKLVGFEVTGNGIARHEYPIARDGKEIGVVTSGSPAPTLQKNIGLGYVPAALTEPGTAFDVMVRGRPVSAKVVKLPFYKRG